MSSTRVSEAHMYPLSPRPTPPTCSSHLPDTPPTSQTPHRPLSVLVCATLAVVYEGTKTDNPTLDNVMLGRSAWAGSQRFGGAVWSGDTSSNW